MNTGGPVTSYVVTVIPSSGSTYGMAGASCGLLVDAPSCVFTGLDATKSYTFRVRSLGLSGERVSDPSDAVFPDAPGAVDKPTVVLGKIGRASCRERV